MRTPIRYGARNCLLAHLLTPGNQPWQYGPFLCVCRAEWVGVGLGRGWRSFTRAPLLGTLVVVQGILVGAWGAWRGQLVAPKGSRAVGALQYPPPAYSHHPAPLMHPSRSLAHSRLQRPPPSPSLPFPCPIRSQHNPTAPCPSHPHRFALGPASLRVPSPARKAGQGSAASVGAEVGEHGAELGRVSVGGGADGAGGRGVQLGGPQARHRPRQLPHGIRKGSRLPFINRLQP